MPPQLALLLCTAFVLFLLRLESRRAREISVALWIPTLWMLIIASRSVGTWFGVRGNEESGSALDRSVLMGLSILGMAVLARRRLNWPGALRHQGWLLLLLAYMLVSTIWSEIPYVALKRWVREIIPVIMALVIMSEANPREALESVLRRTAYVLIPFSLVLVKYYPVLGRQYGRWSGIQMWVGVTTQKNGLGRLCMISVFFLLWAMYVRWRGRRQLGGRYQGWADVSVIFIAMFLLIGSDSATSLATLTAGVVSFLALSLFRSQVWLVALVIFLIGFGVAAPFLGGTNVATFSTSLGRDATLTGRTEIWAELIPAFERQPILGHGTGSYWTTERERIHQINTAHNGYLDILLDLGVVGLALYTIWLLSCVRKLHRAAARQSELGRLAACYLLMALVYNATESAFSSLAEHITAVMILTSIVVPSYSAHAIRRSTWLQEAGRADLKPEPLWWNNAAGRDAAP